MRQECGGARLLAMPAGRNDLSGTLTRSAVETSMLACRHMAAPTDDVLTQILEQTRLRGRVYCQSVARAPWGLRFDDGAGAMFHVVTAGACWLFVGSTRRQLVSGDIVLLPRGTPHALADHPKSKRMSLEAWMNDRTGSATALRLGGAEGAEAKVLCGVFEFDVAGTRHPVLRLLPEMVHLAAERTRERADLAGTVAALAREFELAARGASLIVSRLLDVLFVQIVRAWADDQPPGGAGWVGALRDSMLARALAAMHEDLARPWDVAALARAGGTSRATLGRRFVAEIGEPPLAYLTRARMQDAARRLLATSDSLATIAGAIGYSSEFAFNKAFRREFAMPPGQYRKRAAP
jgi:AraC-like DNA-binding protein